MSILEQHGLSDKTFKLGRVCKHGHDWKGTGHSLRYLKKSTCVECKKNYPDRVASRNRRVARENQKLKEAELIKGKGLDPAVFQLGKLCDSDHNWNDTGKTLRYKSNHSCPCCKGIEFVGIGKSTVRYTTEERFWRHVDKHGPQTAYVDTPCWQWTGGLAHGYGSFHAEDEGHSLAHRYSYNLHNGVHPEDLWVCHKCNNPTCVNPEHLYLGTPVDNAKDMTDALRGCHGEKSVTAVLKESEVLAIYEEYHSSNISMQALAERYRVLPTAIHNVLKGKTWKHLGLKATTRKLAYAKLTEDDIVWIRSLDIANNPDYTYTAVGRKLGVDRKTIEDAAKYKNWKHIA